MGMRVFSPAAMACMIAFAALWAPRPAAADPGAAIRAGGAVKFMGEHPTVRLVSERIIIEPGIDDSLIDVRLHFDNTGAAAIVPMAFPVILQRGPGYFDVRGLKVEAGGKSIDVEKLPGTYTGHGPAGPRVVLFGFDVRFERGQKQDMRIRYRQWYRYRFCNRFADVSYVLYTGGTWKGTVDDVRLEVRLGDRGNYHSVRLIGENDPDRHSGWERKELAFTPKGDTLHWQARNYDGTPQVVRFCAARGPAEVSVDGKPVRELAGDVFRWRHGQLLVQIDGLARLLSAEQAKPWPPVAHAAGLTRDGRTAQLSGSMLPTYPHSMPGNAPSHAIFVDPTPALKAFGGTLRVESRRNGDAAISFTRPTPRK